MNTSSLNPTRSTERIQALDVLRGFAILGILIMNIQSFSMPGAAYTNPAAYGDLNGINKWVWIISHVFADQKFMSIFSILFGAGVVLVTDRAEERTGKSAGLHYKRNFGLLIIGLIHAHLIWYGDILVAYSICAFLVYLLRKKSPRSLLILGIILMSVHTLIYLFFGFTMPNWPEESIAGVQSSWSPSMELINAEIAAITGTLSEQISQNSESAIMLETFVFLILMGWRAGGLMLVGMAFYKLGILSASKSISFYRKMLIFCGIPGLVLIIYGVFQNFNAGWSHDYSMFIGSQWNYWGSYLLCMAYIAGLMLFVKSNMATKLKARLAAIGQMALTNYISQSIICVLIFYGIGFGLFGQVDRWGQLLIVLAVWVLQLAWSRPWLKKFRFGPLEWLWRSMTYGKRQQMVRE